MSYFPSLLEKINLSSGVVVDLFAWQGTRVIAPLIAGFIFALYGGSFALLFSCLLILIFIVLAVLDVLGIGIVPLLIESAVAENSESMSSNWLDGLIPIVPGYSQIEVLSVMVVLLFFIKSVVFIFSKTGTKVLIS